MNHPRRRALLQALIAMLLMAPVWAWLLMLDYGPPGLWAPHPAFFVGLLTPGFYVLTRAGYVLVMGRPGPYPLFGPKPADW